MGKKIRLGLIFTVDENWIGGSYYILNLISALRTLPAGKQPSITILSKRESDFEAAKQTAYQNLHYHNPYTARYNRIERIINKVSSKFLNRNIIDKRISGNKIDVLFPATNEAHFDRVKKKIYWFPDFQHLVYPDFFTKAEIDARNFVIHQIAESHHHLVLSSNAAKNDWDSQKFKKNCTVNVIPFAVSHPVINDIEIDELLKEFKISPNYFIISNQFWVHKNHSIILKAAKALKEEGVAVEFVFTGKEDDYRNPGYFKSIGDFINEHDLSAFIKILGLIDRTKQLKLMQYSKAVIQPSLFEGWSTVIEDAKSLGQTVIASNIAVHREQLPNSSYFFDPDDEQELIKNMKLVSSSEKNLQNGNYQNNIKLFGEQFYELIETVKQPSN